MMTQSRYIELLDEFMIRIEDQRYFEAHESLEAIWFPRRFEKSMEMNLLRGFINAAVSFELIKRGRPEASLRAWKTYLKYRPILCALNSPYVKKYENIAKNLEAFRFTLENNQTLHLNTGKLL